ncbi:unnamed protein product [Adineta steineri]|uniref:Uncharacterized protein n=1 Tax=Adineta steineri TaxID=433720 RepID=A0A818P4H9_9BILA|nr:unnamed protein product [Adineta steineri]CAF3615585.1 unnamed protein product [Adineta steineri]
MNIISLTLITSIFVAKTSLTTANRSYLVKRVNFNVFKFSEFSIFRSKHHLAYRIKSSYAFRRKLEIIDVSTNQVVCRLTNKISLTQSGADFTILNSTSDEWITGKILRKAGLNQKYHIKWDGNDILMKTKFNSLTTTFEHEYQSGILAKFKRPFFPLIFGVEFDLQIFSNDVPDIIYFIGLVMKDQDSSAGFKG